MSDLRGGRLLALDFIRGICLVVITLNHFSSLTRALGYHGPQVWTPTMLGYSSAAELFFLISGYLIGSLYAQPEVPFGRMFVRVSHRALYLYLYNALLFLLLLAFSSALSPHDIASLKLGQIENPYQAAASFLFFQGSPPLLDVLQLYVVFLLAALAFVPLAVRAPRWAWALTLGLYVICQFPALREDLGLRPQGWSFNPFAWQLMFMGGVLLGSRRALVVLDRLVQRRDVVVGTLGLLFALTVFFVLDRKLGLTPDVWWGKRDLGVLRVVHAALMLVAYWWLRDLLQGRLQRLNGQRVLDALSGMGRHSLDVFALGVVFSYAGAVLQSRVRYDALGYLLIAGAMVLLLWLFSRYLQWRVQLVNRPT